MPPVIALHGAYFGKNFGDILLMRLFCGQIRGMLPDARVVLAKAPSTNVEAIGADGTGPLELAKAKALVFGGGGYFGQPQQQTWRWAWRNYRLHVRLAEQARRRSLPYAILGVGFGPLTTPVLNERFVKACRHAQVFAVRDRESVEYATRYGIPEAQVHPSADAALGIHRGMIAPADLEKAYVDFPAGPTRIGVHLSHTDHHRDSLLRLAEQLLVQAGTDRSIELVFLNDSVVRVIPRIYEGLLDKHGRGLAGRLTKERYSSVDRLLAVLDRMDAVLTNKLHVGICASALGKPVLSVPLHSKTRRLYKQIERSHCCIEPDQLGSLDVMGFLREQIAAGPVRIPQAVLAASAENFRLLRDFLASTAYQA